MSLFNKVLLWTQIACFVALLASGLAQFWLEAYAHAAALYALAAATRPVLP